MLEIFVRYLDEIGITGIDVMINPEYLAITVPPGRNQIDIPPGRTFSSERVIELVAHEIRTHLLRSHMQSKNTAGKGLGLLQRAPFSSRVEEGVAIHHELLVDGMKDLFSVTLKVLAVDEAAGGNTPRFIFEKMCRYYLLWNLLGRKPDSAQVEAKKQAFTLLKRILRGTSGQTPGAFFGKDATYKTGLDTVRAYLKDGGDFDDLFLGKVDVEHIPVYKGGLGFTQPPESRRPVHDVEAFRTQVMRIIEEVKHDTPPQEGS